MCLGFRLVWGWLGLVLDCFFIIFFGLVGFASWGRGVGVQGTVAAGHAVLDSVPSIAGIIPIDADDVGGGGNWNKYAQPGKATPTSRSKSAFVLGRKRGAIHAQQLTDFVFSESSMQAEA